MSDDRDPLEIDETDDGWLAGTSWRAALDLPLADPSGSPDGGGSMTNSPRRPRLDTEVRTAKTERLTTEAEADDLAATTVLPTGEAPVVAALGIDEAVVVATTMPSGADIDAGLEGLSVGGIAIDTEPDHLGVDLSVGGVTTSTSVEDALTFGTATTATAPTSEATVGSGLGPMPGSSLYSGDTGEGDGDVGAKPLNTYKAPGEEEVEEKAWYEEAWDAAKAALTPGGSTEPPDGGTDGGKGTKPTLQPYPIKSSENPDADVVGTDASIPSVVLQEVVTGMDPTTTTPAGPAVDDGGAAPITADDITGDPAVGGFGVPINPGVLDGDGVLDITPADGGDPGVLILATSPDTIGPNDPVLGGAEPITADALTGPASTIANPIAGGEDEDLEDLEIQRLTPGSTPATSGLLAGDEELGITGDLSESRLLSPALSEFEGPAPSGELEGFDDGLLET